MKSFIILFSILLLVSCLLSCCMKQFGKLPTGKRLERIKKSPNYENESFNNQSITPSITDGANLFTVMKAFFFDKSNRNRPKDTIPTKKTDILNLDINQNVLVWFGHSSYFIQIDGKKILVDPVLSGYASPFSFYMKSFNGTDQYSVDDIPEIDYLLISHDHWDHLDYNTVLKLKPKIKQIICGLGTGQHFEYWGFDTTKIIEKDWNEKIALDSGFNLFTVPSRHFSGRGITRNKSLWVSFVLQTPSMKIFIGGDSGYDKHFKEIGETFGEFDLAILENGQYNRYWKNIHMMPNEILKASKELNAKKIFPVHSSKFDLSLHAWDEPLKLIIENNKSENINIITPMIGEKVNLKDSTQKFSEWWENID